MLNVLELVYSWPFAWGALAGTALWRLYCHAKARLEDRHDPLPEGRHHAVTRMSRQWIAGLVMAITLGWVLLATAHAEQHTTRLNEEVTRCWQETYQQIRAQVLINADNDGISRQQQALQREYDEDTATWLKQLVSPPGDMATQPTNSPDRQAWGIKVSIEYQTKLDDLGARFDALVAQRKELDRQRAEHPLPEARCGRTS